MTLTLGELRRVGLAVALLVAGNVAVVLALMPLTGYSSLAQAGPKAAVDALALGLLVGRRARWRLLALAGVVAGMFFGLVTPAYPHLLVLFTLAGAAAATTGYLLTRAHRFVALAVAMTLFEMVVSLGKPVAIVLAGAGDEPVIWAAYFGEWPLRVAGVMVGLRLAWGFRPVVEQPLAMPVHVQRIKRTRRGEGHAAACLVLAVLGSTVPMMAVTWGQQAVIAGVWGVVAMLLGMRRVVLVGSVAAVAWSWGLMGAASYVMYQDGQRVVELGRTFALRFLPMTLSALLVMTSVSGLSVFRLLRRLRVSAAVLLPLSSALRAGPVARRRFEQELALLRSSGEWTGPMSLLRRPRRTASALVWSPLRGWANHLAEPPTRPS